MTDKLDDVRPMFDLRGAITSSQAVLKELDSLCTARAICELMGGNVSVMDIQDKPVDTEE